MTTGNHLDKPTTQNSWPHCPHLNDICFLYDMSNSLGTNILDTLLRFIDDAEEGSRLTLQRNRDGFTAQVTGPVQRTSKDAATLERLLELRNKMLATRQARAAAGPTSR